MLGGRTLDYGIGAYLIIGVEMPIVGHIYDATPSEPFLGIGVDLDPGVIAALLFEMKDSQADADHGPVGAGVAPVEPPLLDAITRLLALADEPEHIAILRPLYEREILCRLLAGPQGDLVRQVGMTDSRLSHIGRAIRFIRDHFAESIRIEQLAELAAMSQSSLRRHFRAVTGISPVQFQKQIRLQTARTRPLAEPDDVASIGFAVGYESASQFSREYRRAFGLPPGRDARARRGAAPAAAGINA